jgi:hypothetical protein
MYSSKPCATKRAGKKGERRRDGEKKAFLQKKKKRERRFTLVAREVSERCSDGRAPGETRAGRRVVPEARVGTYDDPALHHDVHVFEQPDLDPRLGLEEPEDQVLRERAGEAFGDEMVGRKVSACGACGRFARRESDETSTAADSAVPTCD